MKILYIARHADSDWGMEGYSDFDRPLNASGFSGAQSMAKYLSSINLKVDSVMTSTAMRAITTAQYYTEQILDNNEPIKIDSIYQADEGEMINLVHEISDDFNVVMLVGHNPTFSLLVELLAGDHINMSAGSIAEVKLDIEKWSDVALNCGKLEQLLSVDNLPH